MEGVLFNDAGKSAHGKCQNYQSVNKSDQCLFVKNESTCHSDGLIQYTEFVFCELNSALVPLAISILVAWWIFLFIALAICADDFFCPCLKTIAKTLRMSDNIAGVTLLAFGNGAPDVFSAIAAVRSSQDGDVGLALGALLGAGIFVSTVVAGTISIAHPFHAMERPFLRDIIFYIGTVFMTFCILYDGEISLIESIIYICLYVFYVIVVIVGRVVYQWMKYRDRARALEGLTVDDPVVDRIMGDERNGSPSIQDTVDCYNAYEPIERNGADTAEDTDNEEAPLLTSRGKNNMETAMDMIPFRGDEWQQSNRLQRIYTVVKTPALFILWLTIPVGGWKEENTVWFRPLAIIQCLIFPVTVLFLASPKFALINIGGVFPLYVLLILMGIALALAVFFTSVSHEAPSYHWVFSYAGFIAAVIWIQLIAGEIVGLLKTFGVVFDISDAILGLTVLAWGNSIGDYIANVVMARHGSPRAGISACYGGPMFNLLMGLGIPFTIMGIGRDEPFKIDFPLIQVVLIAALFFSLLSALVIVPIMRFNFNRPFGIYLIVVYVVFLLIAMLVETHVIPR